MDSIRSLQILFSCVGASCGRCLIHIGLTMSLNVYYFLETELNFIFRQHMARELLVS
jgi:hypothetical protein